VSSDVVALGGSVESGSQSDRAMRAVVSALTARGVEVQVFPARRLHFPPYHPGAPLTPEAGEFVEAVRAADALVVASPGYHGIVSGLVKNALDYLEELRSDERPYLHGRPVGLVAVAGGWQAAVGTLGSLRQVVHALRGWPTPLGLAINSRVTAFDDAGHTDDVHVAASIPVLCEQLVTFKAG
jgi:FMN reductase